MMQKFINNWGDTITAQVLVAATTIPVSLAKAALISDASVNNFYLATLMENGASNPDIDEVEVVRITAADGGTGNLTVVREVDDTAAKQWESGASIDALITAQTLRDATGREVLTADRTYYVDTAGSDANDGLTIGNPFATVQKAIDTVAMLDLSIYDATIQLADGTYTENIILKSAVGAGSVILQGNLVTPSNVVLTSTTGHTVVGIGLTTPYEINDCKIQSTAGSGIRCLQAPTSLHVTNVEFGVCAVYQVYAANKASIIVTDPIVSGNASSFARIGATGFIQVANSITLTGVPAFAGDFCTLSEMGEFVMASSVTITGTATGKRYTITLNGVAQTFGAATTFFPGSIAGTTATGGQYA